MASASSRARSTRRSSASAHPELSVASLRYAIVYGEREWYGRVLTLFLKRALEGQPPVVFGAGDQVRDFVYAGDIAVLHRRCFETDFDGHLVLNGSTGGRHDRPRARRCDLRSRRAIASNRSTTMSPKARCPQLAGGPHAVAVGADAMRMSYERAHATVGWEPQVSLAKASNASGSGFRTTRIAGTSMSY